MEQAQRGTPAAARLGYLVPAAVVLRGRAVVLQDFGDGALVDALEVQLPLPEFQETPETRETSLPCVAPSSKHPSPQGERVMVGGTKAFLIFTLALRKQHDGANGMPTHMARRWEFGINFYGTTYLFFLTCLAMLV